MTGNPSNIVDSLVYLNSLLLNIPDKSEFKDTTTRKWKFDLVKFILESNVKSVLEVGSAKGHTTYTLSKFVDFVTSIEYSEGRLNESKTLNKENTNITYYQDDVYQTDWTKYGYHDLVIIDCVHTFESVIQDIRNACINIRPKFIAFDDYSLFPEVRQAVDGFIEGEILEIVARIGAPPGSVFSSAANPNAVKNLIDYEGVICRVL